jgi:hypothetical protein
MRTFVISCIIIFVSILFQYCSTVKRSAVSCPQFSGYKLNETRKKIRRNNKIEAVNNEYFRNHRKQVKTVTSNIHLYDSVIHFSSANLSNNSDRLESAVIPYETNYLKSLTASANNSIVLQPDLCDTIFLKKGSYMNVKIDRIGLWKIRYHNCNIPTGPKSSISVFKVLSFSYNNEKQKNSSFSKNNPQIDKTKRKPEPLGLAGFAFSISGLFFLGSLSLALIFLIATGSVLGWISYIRIKRHPDKYKGRAFAQVSIVLGYALLIFLIIFFSAIIIDRSL